MNDKLSYWISYIKKSIFYEKIYKYVWNGNNYKKGWLLSGNWGSGKTTLCKRLLENNEVFKINGCLISLFNCKNIDELRLAILHKVNKKGLKIKKFLNFFKNTVINATSIFFNSMLDEFKKINLNVNRINWKHKKFHNFLICLDDFDRTKIPYQEIFGLINNLIDSGCKVLLISNSFDNNENNLTSLGFHNENKSVLKDFREKLFIDELKLDETFFNNAINEISMNELNELNNRYGFIDENLLNKIVNIVGKSIEFAKNLRVYYEFLDHFKEIIKDILKKNNVQKNNIQDIFLSYLKYYFRIKEDTYISFINNEESILHYLLIQYFIECRKYKIKPEVDKIIDKLKYARSQDQLKDFYNFFIYFYRYKEKEIWNKIQLFIKWLKKQKTKVEKETEDILQRILYSIIYFYSIIEKTEDNNLDIIINKLADILQINNKFKFTINMFNPYQSQSESYTYMNNSDDYSKKENIYLNLVRHVMDLYFEKRKENSINVYTYKCNYNEPKELLIALKKIENEHKFVDILCKINDMKEFVNKLVKLDGKKIDEVRFSLFQYYQRYGIKEFIEDVSNETIAKMNKFKELLEKKKSSENDPIRKELLSWFVDNINELINKYVLPYLKN